jgi:hypothetical protein
MLVEQRSGRAQLRYCGFCVLGINYLYMIYIKFSPYYTFLKSKGDLPFSEVARSDTVIDTHLYLVFKTNKKENGIIKIINIRESIRESIEAKYESFIY